MMLEYTENNLDLSVNCTSLDDGLDYLIKIQTEAIDKTTLPIADKKLIKRMLPEQRKLYLKKNINDGLLTKGEENPEAFTIDEITKSVDNSYASGLLDDFERESLLRLIDMSVESAKGESLKRMFLMTILRKWCLNGNRYMLMSIIQDCLKIAPSLVTSHMAH